MDLEPTYQLIKQLAAFKNIERFRDQFYWKDYNQRTRYESTADHSWRMAMVLILIEGKLSQSINLEKALKMALIHDLPEIITGDPSPLGKNGTGEDSHAYNQAKIDQKYSLEQAAVLKLFSNLPQALSKELCQLWEEFENGESYESKLIRSLDKWEAKLQVLEYTAGKMFPDHFEFTIGYRDEYFNFDPTMRKLMDRLLLDFKQSYTEFLPSD